MPDLTSALPSTATNLNPLGRVKTISYTCLPPCKNLVIELAMEILIVPCAALVIPTCTSANQ